MKKLRIGVIGTGTMGKNHVRNISEEKRFEFVGIYDSNMEQSNNVANIYGTKPFDSMVELLARVDAVVVAVPSSLHKEIALQVADHGVHALIEKPLAPSSKDAKEIVNAFSSKNLKLAVGHVERFNPAFKELKKLVNPNTVYYIEASRYSPYSGSGRITDVSVVEDLMIHDVDLVCAIMDNIKLTSIQGKTETIKSKKADFATCIMDFDGKAHAIVNASRVSQNKERKIKIHTIENHIDANLLSKSIDIYKGTNIVVELTNNNSYKQDGVVQKIYVPIEEPLRAELISFYDSVVNDAPIVVDGNAAVRAITICEKVIASSNK